MKLWLIVVAVGVATFAIRLSFILLEQRWTMPPTLRRALRFVPAAALSAIILPELLLRDGVLALSLTNVRLLAGSIAIVIAWRTRNVVLTIASGMAAFWLLAWLLSYG